MFIFNYIGYESVASQYNYLPKTIVYIIQVL